MYKCWTDIETVLCETTPSGALWIENPFSSKNRINSTSKTALEEYDEPFKMARGAQKFTWKMMEDDTVPDSKMGN